MQIGEHPATVQERPRRQSRMLSNDLAQALTRIAMGVGRRGFIFAVSRSLVWLLRPFRHRRSRLARVFEEYRLPTPIEALGEAIIEHSCDQPRTAKNIGRAGGMQEPG